MMLASKANMFVDNAEPEEYWGLYFEAEEANCVVNMNTYYTSGGVRTTVNLESSRDGVTWTDFDGNSTTGTTPVTLANIGDRVYIRSKGTTDGNAFTGDGSAKFYRYFTLSKKAGAHGSIMSLVNGSEQKTSFPADWFFVAAFDSCAKLTTAPELPVTSLRKGCYNNLFWGCTGLTTPPELPATSLAVNCYQYMFAGCTALTTAPELPATYVDSYAYSHMFEGCTSLTAAPDIYAQLGSYGCENMFKGCTSLTTAQGRIRGVNTHSCRFMFQNCTSLTTAPYLQSLGDNTTYEPYRAMFSGCSRLSSISVGFASWTIGGYVATPSWVSNVAASGTLTCPAALGTNETITRGVNNCPTGWTVQNV